MPPLSPGPPSRALAVIPDEADHEWHRFRGDLADVNAAIASLAEAFQLTSVDEHRWELRAGEPEIRGLVTIRVDSGETTSVGLQLAPMPAESALAEAVEVMASAWPLWLILALLGALSGLELIGGALVVLMALAMVPPVALVIAAFEASRVHQDRLWIADWRARFLPALTAHLTTRQPYR